MKKLIYCAFALAAALLAGSCQRELLDTAGSSTVTYTVELPDVQTKAKTGDGSNVTHLIYEVWRTAKANDTELNESASGASEPRTERLYSAEATRQGDIFKFDVDLVQNQNYTILFWAHVVDATGVNAYYNTSDLRNVTLTERALGAFDEDRAAFYGIDFIVANEPRKATQQVTLTRPFGQLNLGTTERNNPNYILNIDKTSVIIKGASTKFNVATGEASSESLRDITFETEYPEPITYDKLNATYDWISMNYIFVPANQATHEVKYTITTNHGSVSNTVRNVPTKKNYRTNILGNLLTSKTDYIVELNKNWEGADITHAMDASAVQTALDNAVAGTTIQLEPGVNYGTLYLRPSANVDVTKEVDWVGNNYRYETYSLFENLTIKGAEGATVDAIEIEGGTYYNSEHSQADKYPIMLSLIELKNVVIDGVTFTGKGGYDPQDHGNAINLSGNNIKVDGLTIKNCTLNNPENNARLIYKTESTTTEHKYTYDDQTKALQEYTFTPSLKNITVTGTTFNGGYMGLELRETENVTITNNVFNVADRNILLAVNNGCTYSGNVTITDNVSNNAKERFVRADGTGDAVVVIEDNILNNYQGADADYIKVTNANNVTIENNVLGVSTAEELQSIVDMVTGETIIKLCDNIDGDVMIYQKADVHIVIDGDGKKYDGQIKVHTGSTRNNGTLLIKNIEFDTEKILYDKNNKPYFYYITTEDFGVENGITRRYSQNITVQDCEFTASHNEKIAAGIYAYQCQDIQVIKCNATEKMHSLIQAQSCDKSVTVMNCTITNSKNGVAFKQVKDATVVGTTIIAQEYGIRFDGNTDNYGITVTDNTITATQPFIVRKMTGKNNTIALERENILTPLNAEFQIVITNGSDDAEYVMPTGTYTLTGAEDYNVYEGNPVAKVGNTEYDTMSKAIDAWTNNTTLTLLADVTLSDVVTLKSTEHHILDLGTYTMTTATELVDSRLSKKNAIEITCNGRSSASYALTVNADATNPGGITATGKSCIYYKKSDSTKDRPIILINNGVFTGSYSINSISNGNTNCPQVWINGGVFNSYMNLTKNLLKVTGGTFHAAINCTGDQSAYCHIQGGRFKSWQFMTADASTKFWVGTAKETYDVGVYVDDEGYLVVGGPVITEFGDKFAAKATNYGKWSSYLKYSSAAVHGLYYTNADMAISKHGEANVVLPTPANEIWYESTEMKLEPTNTDALNATILKNEWNIATGKGVITFDKALTTIGAEAFKRETNTTPSNWITSISFPEGLESIGNYAFAQCYSLLNIVIPSSVTSVGAYAFQGCDAVASVTIGSGVTSIGSGAFYNCDAIKEIICKSTTPPELADKWVFYGVETESVTVVVPAGAEEAYKAAWTDFTNIVSK